MSATAEEVQRAIDRARAAQDTDAVNTLEGYLKTLQPSQSQPAPEVTGALTGNNHPTGQGASGPALTRAQRERRIGQLAYEADDQLKQLPQNHPGRPTQQDIQAFRNKNITAKTPNGRDVGLRDISGEVVRDQKTGAIRWAAVSPDDADAVAAKQKARQDAKDANITALTFGVVNPIGEFIDYNDKEIEARNITQQLIWEQLPSGEQDRMLDRVRKDHGDDAAERFIKDAGMFPSNVFKEIMDENPDNEKLLDNLAGDEWWEERKETLSRSLARIGSAWTFGQPVFGFGANDPQGAISGRGAFEGIDYEGKDKPKWDGASEDIREWKGGAKSSGLYEHILKPLATNAQGQAPGERVLAAAQDIRGQYTEAELASANKPFIPEGKGIEDIFTTEFWNDPNTKMPWNDWTGFKLTFMENAVQIAISIGVARGTGSVGARHAVSANAGRGLETIEAARRKYAGTYGAVAGGGTEGLLIHNNVAREVSQSLSEVSIEKWAEDKTFNDLVDAGLNHEEAKQLLTQDAASTAGTTAFVWAGLAAGAPMSYMIGQSGAGRLASKATAGRVGIALLGEPLQEGTQEVIEGEISDAAIAGIDPEHPIFAQENRRLERFAGGAFIAGPMGIGALATIEYGTPAGYEKADVDAAIAAKTMMDAVNERYKLELKLSNQEYRDNTAPLVRLANMQKLEGLQKKEAETIRESAKVLREYLQSHPSQTSKVELKRLNAMEMQANAMLTDIAVARSRRQTVSEMVEEQESILMERAAIQEKVSSDLISLEDINRQAANIEAVQNNEAISEEAYAELMKEGYGKWTNQAHEKFVIRPKGKRALNLLNQQSRHLAAKMQKGYTGTERRNPVNQTKRDVVESAGPVEREQILYTDNMTGVQNRRAFNERQEHIDVREGETKRAIGEETPLQKARSGDVDAQANLTRFGLGWDGNKPKYRLTGKDEIDTVLAGNTVQSNRDGSGVTDVTDNPDYAKVPASYRITFKQTDKFDSDLGGNSPIRVKNEKHGEYHLTGGYSLEDIQTIEKRQPDGTWQKVHTAEAPKRTTAATRKGKPAAAVAAVDVDSLSWVNDHMTHAAGDRLLVIVADALKQEGVEVYRLGGDEFAVTGSSQAALEKALQAAAKKLENSPIADSDQEVKPTITWGKGKTYAEADKEAGSRKAERIQRGKIAPRKDKPTSWSARAQLGLFQLSVTPGDAQKQLDKLNSTIGKSVTLSVQPYYESISDHGVNPKSRSRKRTVSINGTIIAAPFGGEVTVVVKTENGSILQFNRRGHLMSSKNHESIIAKGDRKILAVAKDMVKRQRAYASGYSSKAVRIDKDTSHGLFQLDEGTFNATTEWSDSPKLASKWRQVSDLIKRGTAVEILTHDGAEWGVVIGLKDAKGRHPRLTVSIEGRNYTFNPVKNHLITHGLERENFVWITGREMYADPIYGALPQTVSDVQIGHITNDGEIIADLYKEKVTQKYEQASWWTNDYPEWHPTIPFVKPIYKVSDAVKAKTELIVQQLTQGNKNLPKINLIYDLKDVPQHVLDQIIAEGAHLSGVRGYMNHINPEDGIYLLVPNIDRLSNDLQAGITETLVHEMVGHYGVRGFFGNEADLRAMMEELIEAFPQVAKSRAYLIKGWSTHRDLNKLLPHERQLLGEEMLAYTIGEEAAGKLKLNAKQKGLIARIIAWIRKALIRMGFIKTGTTADFWDDARVRKLVSRARDFVRNGKGFEWTALTGEVIKFDTPLLMRDAEIFQQGVVTAITTGTEKLTKARKEFYAKTYGGIANVPDVVPMFPESASPNNYRWAFQLAVKERLISNLEMKTSGLDETGTDWALLRDATYLEISELLGIESFSVTEEISREWYKEVMPPALVKEMDDLFAQRDAAYMVGPPRASISGDAPRKHDIIDTDAWNKSSDRLKEIMAMKLDQKNSRIPKKVLLAHAASNKALKLKVMRQGGYQNIDTNTVVQYLFGDPDKGYQDLTDAERDLVNAEKIKAQQFGPMIEYNPELNRWLDWAGSQISYRDFTPEGAISTPDYRIYLILQEGSYRMGDVRHNEIATVPTAHWNGIPHYMHIRTAVATLVPIEGELVLPDARNPELQGKAITMIEAQSNLMQELRYAYTTEEEKTNQPKQYTRDSNDLGAMGKAFVASLVQNMWEALDNKLKPIYNLPDGNLQPEYRQFAERETGLEWDAIDSNRRHQTYNSFVGQKINPLIEQVKSTLDVIAGLPLVKLTGSYSNPGINTMDARGFDILDKYAASQVVRRIKTDLDTLLDELRILRDLESQAGRVSNTNAIKSNFMSTLSSYSSDNWKEQKRLPYATEAVKQFLTPILRELEMESVLDGALSAIEIRERAIVRVPKAALGEYISAASTSMEAGKLVEAMFANSRMLDAGIQAIGLSLSFDSTTDQSQVDVSISGTKEQITSVENHLKELIKMYVTTVGPTIRAAALNKATDGVADTSDGIDWDTVESATSAEVISVLDPSSSERSTLNNYGVLYFENFMGDSFDWEETYNNDGEGLWEESSDYQDRVTVDEDGDTDIDDATEWLDNARESFRSERWDESPPALILGDLPTSWDEDGYADNHVNFYIKSGDVGNSYDVFIDHDEFSSHDSLEEAQEQAGKDIAEYYYNNDITVPFDSPWALAAILPEVVALPNQLLLEGEPDFNVVADNIGNAASIIPMTPEQGSKIFERMVSFEKNKQLREKKGIDNRVIWDTPLSGDDVFRPVSLYFMLAEAVRRGAPAIAWNNGLASSKRGGEWGVKVARPTSRIIWTQESITVRGQTQDMFVIRSPDFDRPFVVDSKRMLPLLGRDLSVHILNQVAGRIPLEPELLALPTTVEPVVERTLRSHFLISSTPSGTYAVHRRSDGSFVGFAGTEEVLEDVMQQNAPEDVAAQPTTNQEIVVTPIQGTDHTAFKMRGTVTEQSLGTKMRIITGGVADDYSHTFPQAIQAGARESYEGVMHRAWEKELKKWGATIQEIYVKGNADTAWKSQGQPTKPTDDREARIRAIHGRVSVEELTGESHGYVIVGETGLITDNIFQSYIDASDHLNSWKFDTFGTEEGVIKMYAIVINDKIVETFSRPVAPFHYDPRQDPVLKDAAEKIGYEDVSFRDKYNKWREAWKDNFQQGMFDRFYGIKRALSNAHETNKGYIQTRLTTSLDSVMKSVMEYGPPVWSNGIVQSDAETGGLLDILQPVMAQIDLWGMYMAGVRAKRLLSEGRENLFSEAEIDAMIALGDAYPQFARVAAKYADFNKKVLDFAEGAGVINPETRPLWENADYVPFYRVEDERLVGPFSGGAGVANQRSPIKRLKGGDANIGNVTHNIMVNLTKLVDSSMKNQAALTTVDALRGSGIISNQPMTFSQQMIPLNQVKKLLIDRGMNPEAIPEAALAGFQKMFAIQPPEGPGVISILREGKKEFYYTDDELLYRAMTNINKKHWGAWMTLFRAPKRLLTTMITLDPGFMAANYVRDSLSAFVISRDHFVPVISGIKGFGQALIKDKAMRTMLSAGAAFESGYINQYDPKSTDRLIKDAMKEKTFARTVLSSPKKLFEAWKAIGSAVENANRMAVYNAAIAAGKSEMQAVYEAKDLMDFSMGGDWPVVQFLIQTVPFMGARMQGLHRLGRGYTENPKAFMMKGLMVGMAGMALFLAFRDDERYKELEEWDKDTYFHWWIGDNHYRLPKPFEVGAIFNTIPERIFAAFESEEKDAGKLFWSRMGHMFAETFNMNPVPQTLRPMVESYFNYNFFQGRSIVSPYEADRMAPEQYRYSTSPTMVELGRALPEGLDVASNKIRSPLHLVSLFQGYTGTLGRYFLLASDAVVRDQMDYPNPPEWRKSDMPVVSRFFRGTEPHRTKYEEETYRLIRKVGEIQGSLRFLEKTEQEGRFEGIQTEWEPYIRVAKDLEDIREDVSNINEAIMHIWMDPEMDPKKKRDEIDALQVDKNLLFELGYKLRPGGPLNLDEPITQQNIRELIDNFGMDNISSRALEGKAPDTFDLVTGLDALEMRDLKRLAESGVVQ